MDLFDRIYALHHELDRAHQPVSMASLEQRLECKRATVNRIIHDMRLFLDAPIHYDRKRNGYYYQQIPAERFELPGLWFTPAEIRALLTLQALLSDIQPGLLNPILAPLNKRIGQILDLERSEKPRRGKPPTSNQRPTQLHLLDPPPEPTPSPLQQQSRQRRAATAELARRIRLITQAARASNPTQLTTVADALGRRRRLHIHYHGRQRNQQTERDISPQRLTHYRDNWYLDAWCHQAKALRRFSLDRISAARPLKQAAREYDLEKLAAHTDNSYGIISGGPIKHAILLFNAERARWIADERWHPGQQAEALPGGRYRLTIPYADPSELILDILRYGPDVEVLAPAELRQAVTERLTAALAQYRDQ